MTPNPHLENLIAAETYAEMLAALSYKQLAVVAFRLDGVPYKETGQLLGISRNCVYERLKYARKTMRENFPNVRSRVGGL